MIKRYKRCSRAHKKSIIETIMEEIAFSQERADQQFTLFLTNLDNIRTQIEQTCSLFVKLPIIENVYSLQNPLLPIFTNIQIPNYPNPIQKPKNSKTQKF